MDFEGDQIEKVHNILKACRVPQLNNDIDQNPVGESDFKEYREMTKFQIYSLLDVLYQNINLICTQAYDNQLIELRVNLIIVACEQLEPNPFFQTDDQLLIQSLRKIIFDHVEIVEDLVYGKCIKYYKESLTNDSWKKNIGATHGFPFFCEILLCHKAKIVNEDFIMFSLSVGSNLISHHDPHYKTIGAKIYRLLMKLCDAQKIKDLNIHSVIFNEILPMIQRSSEIDFNDHVYECLYQVIKIECPKVKDTNWCKFDDVMTKLINQFSTEGDAGLCKLLLHYILKFCTISNEKAQISFDDISKYNEIHFVKLRQNFQSSNYRTARWVKKLMDMITRESVKMLNNTQDAISVLNYFHCIYISTTFTFNSTIFQDQLDEFIKKFVFVLMQVVRTSKNQAILKAVGSFINTIKIHQSHNQELTNCLNKIQEKFFE